MARSNADTPLAKVPDDAWQAAREREKVIRALVHEPPPYGARVEAMDAAAAELGLNSHHIYRLMKAYEADPRTRSLLPKSPGPPAGRRRLHPRVETIIEEEIQTRYMDLLKPKKSLLMKGIRARCAAEGLGKPARETVEARLERIPIILVHSQRLRSRIGNHWV